MLLLDASAWVAAGLSAHPAHGAAAPLVRGDVSVAALDLTFYEVVNVVGRQYRQPDQAQTIARAMLRTCGADLIRVDQELAEDVVKVGEQHGLTAYDAAYVAAARRHGWQLVSLDVRDLVSKGLAVTPEAADYP